MMDQDLALKAELSLFCQNLKSLNTELRTPFEQFSFVLVIMFIRDQKKKNKLPRIQDLALDNLKSYFRIFFNRQNFDRYASLEDSTTFLSEVQISYYALQNLRDFVLFLKLVLIQQKVSTKQINFLVKGGDSSMRGNALPVPQYLKQLNDRANHIQLPTTLSQEQLKHLQNYEFLRNAHTSSGSCLFKESSTSREQDGDVKKSLRMLNWRLRVRQAFVQAFINRNDLTANHPDVLKLKAPSRYILADFVSRVLVLASANGSISVFQSRHCNTKQSFNIVVHEDPPSSLQGLERVHQLKGHQGCITAIAISQDECYLLSASMDHTIRLWCLRLGTCIANYKSHLKTIWSLKWAETGLYFLSGSADCTARLWRTDTHYTIRIYAQHNRDVKYAVFLRNNQYILTASLDKTMRIWEVKSKSSVRVLYTVEPVHRLVIDYFGQYMVTAQESGQMVLWNLQAGNAHNVFNLLHLKKKMDLDKKKAKFFITDLDFSVDGRAFACCSKKEIAIFMVSDLLQKPTRDIGQLKDQEGKGREEQVNIYGHIKPKQVLDIGQESRLIRLKFHPQNYIIAVGTAL